MKRLARWSRSIPPSLLKGGLVAATIKAIGSSLAFAMTVMVASITSETEFGRFGASVAAYSMLGIVGVLGQQSSVMRFWAQSNGAGDRQLANSYVGYALKTAFVGLAITGALSVFAAYWAPGDWRIAFILVGLLSFAFGWSEAVSGALRARGSLWLALAPRDVIWRFGAILALAIVVLSGATTIDANIALVILLSTLIVPTVVQTWTLLKLVRLEGSARLTRVKKLDYLHTTLGLWGINALPVVLGQINTIIVAALLGPFWAGMYFAAERSSQLIVLVTNGMNQAIAPAASAAFYSGDVGRLRRMSDQSALASTIAGFVILAAMVIASGPLMGLFDPSYDTTIGIAVLSTVGLGQAFIACSGSTNAILQMTGHQKAFFKIVAVSGVVGSAITILFTVWLGVFGTALGGTITSVLWNALAVRYARSRLSMDPSILGVLLPSITAPEGDRS